LYRLKASSFLGRFFLKQRRCVSKATIFELEVKETHGTDAKAVEPKNGVSPPSDSLVSEKSDGEQYWRRPGKSHGHSALTSAEEPSRLVVFSESAYPFDSVADTGHTYSKFDAFKTLNCQGDYGRAMREIARLGYTGSKPSLADRIAKRFRP